jgi:hypothetical protein
LSALRIVAVKVVGEMGTSEDKEKPSAVRGTSATCPLWTTTGLELVPLAEIHRRNTTDDAFAGEFQPRRTVATSLAEPKNLNRRPSLGIAVAQFAAAVCAMTQVEIATTESRN